MQITQPIRGRLAQFQFTTFGGFAVHNLSNTYWPYAGVGAACLLVLYLEWPSRTDTLSQQTTVTAPAAHNSSSPAAASMDAAASIPLPDVGKVSPHNIQTAQSTPPQGEERSLQPQTPSLAKLSSQLPEIDADTRRLFVHPENKDHPRLRLEAEARDPVWADVIELELRNRLVNVESSSGATLQSLACRTTLCEVQLRTETTAPGSVHSANLRKVLPEAEFSRVDSFTIPDGNGGQRIIAYGLRKAGKT
jgi:hypothetical protein